jgi:hypothetical protein
MRDGKKVRVAKSGKAIPENASYIREKKKQIDDEETPAAAAEEESK